MNKSWGIIAVSGLVLSLTACGGTEATWSGAKVSDPDKAMKSIDDAWKTRLANESVKVRTTDDSRCYFETSESDGKKILGNQVLCGPYRELGSESTSWDTAEIAAIGADADSVSVGLSQQDATRSPFSQGKPAPNLAPWRPDGANADLAATVDEPDAPKLAVGDVLQGVTIPDSVKAVEGEDIITPTGRYTTRFATLPRAGSGNDRRAAPDGGTILAVEVRRADSGPGSTSQGIGSTSQGTGSTAFSVKAGGKDYPVSLDGNTATAIAVAGDGKDATYAYTYDGLTQSLDAAGKRVGSKAAGYYLPVTNGTSPDVRVQLGTPDGSQPGWHGAATLSDIKVTLSAYDSTSKWAADGKVWGIVTAHWSEDGPSYKPADTYGDTYNTTATLKSVTLGGIKASSNTFSANDGLKASFLLPADAAARTLRLQTVINSAGPVSSSFPDAGSPRSANNDFTFDTTLTLQN